MENLGSVNPLRLILEDILNELSNGIKDCRSKTLMFSMRVESDNSTLGRLTSKKLRSMSDREIFDLFSRLIFHSDPKNSGVAIVTTDIPSEDSLDSLMDIVMRDLKNYTETLKKVCKESEYDDFISQVIDRNKLYVHDFLSSIAQRLLLGVPGLSPSEAKKCYLWIMELTSKDYK